MAIIVEKRDLTPITSLFEVNAPLIARNAQPGQFVMIRVNQQGERIPVTITDSNRSKGLVTIVVQVVGKTTHLLRSLERGDRILDFVGPLGRPVELPKHGQAALVGGGFGTGAILSLAKELAARGVEVCSIIGARTRDLIILEKEVRASSDHTYLCTDDGSQGFHGFVTGQLEALVRAGMAFDQVVAIGPIAMMRAVAETTRPLGIKTQVSMDPIMVDGTGMCGACRLTVDGQLKFACVDGPFFDAHQVNFAEAIVRSKTYAEEERAALTTAVAAGG
ncbi:MAG: sulfide/dihydroorotate dehydrogenase-like FAD/NAD-binding protein [Chloroflexi bacterium]|nr:sulfide/dihydroorotate dehydrogenase-like FAD/NAD-binding protein [Chloroflexota bacterium]